MARWIASQSSDLAVRDWVRSLMVSATFAWKPKVLDSSLAASYVQR